MLHLLAALLLTQSYPIIGPNTPDPSGVFPSPITAPNFVLSNGSATATTVYANSATGIDSATCGASYAPCATFQRVYDNQPVAVLCSGLTIDLTGSYAGLGYVNGNWFAQRNCTPTGQGGPSAWLKIIGHPPLFTTASGPNTGAFTSGTLGNSGIIGNGSPGGNPAIGTGYGTATLTAAGWTINDLTHQLVAITAGTGVGEEMTISSNTTDTITIDGIWPLKIAPDSTSVFQILNPAATGGTVVNATMARPPGAFASGYYAANSTGSAALYVSGSSVSTTAYGSGSSSSQYSTSTAFDPQIDIEGIYFNLSGNLIAVAVDGPVAIGFRRNVVKGGGALEGYDYKAWHEANYEIMTGGLGATTCTAAPYVLGPSNCGVVSVGNWVDCSGCSSNSSVAYQSGGNLIAAFNHTTSTLPRGIYIGEGVQVQSVGNDWNNSGAAISYSLSAGNKMPGNPYALIDGDSCTGTNPCVYVRYGGTVELISDPIIGSGNTLGFNISNGAQLWLGVTPTLTSTTDIQANGNTYTIASVVATNGLVVQSDGTTIGREYYNSSDDMTFHEPGNVYHLGGLVINGGSSVAALNVSTSSSRYGCTMASDTHCTVTDATVTPWSTIICTAEAEVDGGLSLTAAAFTGTTITGGVSYVVNASTSNSDIWNCLRFN